MIYELIVRGFKEDGFKKDFERDLDDLMESAPSDASASSTICKLKKGYSGIIDICSSQGHFIAKAMSKDPEEMVQSLFGQIHQQLHTWQGERHVEAI